MKGTRNIYGVKLATKTYSFRLEAQLDQLDVSKLNTDSADLSKLSNVVNKNNAK